MLPAEGRPGSELAAEYRRILPLLRLFPAAVPALGQLSAMRSSASAWVRRWALAPHPEVRVTEEEGPHGPVQVFHAPAGIEALHAFYLHGGGLVFYAVADYAGVLSHLAHWGGCTVSAFSYVKAPERTFDDVLASLAEAIAHRLSQLPPSIPLTLAGDSVGAYLALFLATRRFPGRFGRLVLVNPVLDLHQQRPSYAQYGAGYPLTAVMMTWFQGLCRAQQQPPFDPSRLSPDERAGLPELLVFSAEFDVLRDEAFAWVDTLGAATAVRHHHFPALAHDFFLYAGAVTQARDGARLVAEHLVEPRRRRSLPVTGPRRP